MGKKEMVCLLSPLGIYRLKEGDKVMAELSAYAAGLSLLETRLTELEREAFLLTAESWGLARREQLFDGTGNAVSVEERRERLIQKFSHVRGAWERESVLNTAREHVPGARLLENAPEQSVRVEGLPMENRPDWYQPLWKALFRLLPAQLGLRFHTNKPDWDAVDGYSYDFDTLDYLGFSWDFLEEL